MMMKVPPSQENGRKEENDIFKIAKKNNFGEEAIRQIIGTADQQWPIIFGSLGKT